LQLGDDRATVSTFDWEKSEVATKGSRRLVYAILVSDGLYSV